MRVRVIPMTLSRPDPITINGKKFFKDESGTLCWEPDASSAQAQSGYVTGTCGLCGYEGWVFPLDENYGDGTHAGETLCDDCNYCPECGGTMDGATCLDCGYEL